MSAIKPTPAEIADLALVCEQATDWRAAAFVGGRWYSLSGARLVATLAARDEQIAALKEQVRKWELRAVGAEAHLCQCLGRLMFDATDMDHKDQACADCGAENPIKDFYCIRHRAARYLDSLGMYDEEDMFPNGIETPLVAALSAGKED